MNKRHMWQKQKKYSFIVYSALLLALVSTPTAATLLVSQIAVVAQQASKEPSFPLPKSVPADTIVRIDGSSSMARINENLKQSFEQQFPGAKVELATTGTDAAIKSVVDGKIDLAAISRGLTPQEEAQGLEQKRLRREKIAIVVGENNPFKGNITNQQFAKIFRGEITNWSQLGGKPGKIRFIDRPASSDTREAFRTYPAFKTGKFATGSNATQLSADDSAELVKQLGDDGIGYVIANQVSKVPGLRVLSLHQTLPDNPKYPFSQPLVYVYKKNPSPSVAGFLGFATAEPGTKAVEAARSAEAAAVAQSVASTDSSTTTSAATPTPAATAGAETAKGANTNTTAAEVAPQANTDTTGAALQANGTTSTLGAQTNGTAVDNNTQAASQETQTGDFPWWLLLPLAALGGGILWWLLGKGNKRSEALEGASTLPIAAASGVSVLPNAAPQGNSFATTANSTDSTNNHSNFMDTNVSGVATNLAAGGAPLAGAATGIGLWPRLAGGNIEVPSADIAQPQANTSPQPQADTSSDVDTEPAAVVMPAHPESNQPPLNLQPTATSTQVASITEPVIDAELPNLDNAAPQGNSNLLNNLNAASGAALAGGAVAGAGLQSLFARSDNNESQEPTDAIAQPELSASDHIEIPNTQSIEPTVAEVDSPQLNQQLNLKPLPDVWDDTEEAEIQTDSNWLNNISSAGSNALAGGAASSGGAALWSQFANRNNNDEPSSDLTLPETPEAPSPDAELVSQEVIETIYIEPDNPEANQTSLVEPTVATEQLPDVWQDDSQESQQSDSNWLDNIQGISQSALAGGAAALGGAAAVGAGLWSKLADSGNNDQPTNEINGTNENNETNEIIVDSEEQDLAASVNIPETTQPTFLQPTSEVNTPETTQPTFLQPTSEVDIPETTQPTFLQPTSEVDIPEVAQPTFLQPTSEVPEAEILEAEVVDTDLNTEKTPSFDNTSRLQDAGADDVALTSDVGGRQWWAPSDSDTETTQAEVRDTPFDAVADVQPTKQPETNTSVTANTESTSTPDFNINPAALAGGAAVVGAGAAFIAGSDNHSQNPDANLVSPTSVPDTTSVTPTTGEVISPVDSDITATTSATSYITFTARTPKWAYVAWNINEQDKQAKGQEGATQLTLRLYDTTDIDLSYQTPQLVQQYECEETIDDRFVAIPGSDRDYMAEIGYLTFDNHWLSIAQSDIVRVFSRPFQEFWFEADAELIIHGATEPGSTVTIGGQPLKLKPDGTFHLRIPFTDELIDYVMTAVAKNGEKAKTIHMHFEQNK